MAACLSERQLLPFLAYLSAAGWHHQELLLPRRLSAALWLSRLLLPFRWGSLTGLAGPVLVPCLINFCLLLQDVPVVEMIRCPMGDAGM